MRLAVLYLVVIILLSFCLQARPYEGWDELLDQEAILESQKDLREAKEQGTSDEFIEKLERIEMTHQARYFLWMMTTDIKNN